MENNITVKEVNFMGDTLMAAQDEDKKVWVGVSWVCEGIGLSQKQRERQVANINKDAVVAQGSKKLSLKFEGQGREVLCIAIDFLPLWLAKISITPAMKRESPELVEKLVAYQLKAKDVLAAAFLPQYVQPAQPTQVFTQTNMTSMLNQFYCCLESTLCSELKTRFNESIPQIISMLSANQPLLPVSTTPIKAVEHIQTLPTFTGCPEGKDWKQWVYYMVDTYIMTTGATKNRKEILSEIYAYLCKNYGMVSDQLAKEYRRNHSGFGRVSTINLIESNKKWRSVFDCVLCDKVSNAAFSETMVSNVPMLPEVPETSSVPNVVIDSTCDGLLNMIAVLIKKRNDASPHGVATHRCIYSKMHTTKEWNYKISGYKRKTSTSTRPSKMAAIMANTKMRKQCAEIVAQLLEDMYYQSTGRTIK